jgi:hypothetical protein
MIKKNNGSALSAAIIRTPTAQQTNEESDFQKRLASPILRHSHFAHSKELEDRPGPARQRTTNTRPHPKSVMLFKTGYLAQNM